MVDFSIDVLINCNGFSISYIFIVNCLFAVIDLFLLSFHKKAQVFDFKIHQKYCFENS